jgi:hypothetical protein
MTQLAFTDPVIGAPFASEAAKVDAALQAIRSWAAGNVDNANFATAELQRLGLSDATTVRRGVSAVTGSDSRTGATYATMPTPDRVTGVQLQSNGLLFIAYQAAFSSSVPSAGSAAVFLNSNQLKVAAAPAPVVQEAATPAGTLPAPLATTALGLACDTGAAATAYTGDVTTGQIVGVFQNLGVNAFYGGPLVVKAAAGTYTVSVQFKASSGSVTASNRLLAVWTWAA